MKIFWKVSTKRGYEIRNNLRPPLLCTIKTQPKRTNQQAFPACRTGQAILGTKGRRIETSMPEMTGPRVELQSDEKVMTEAKSEDRTPGDCNQWLAKGQCSCSFKHDMSKRGIGKVNVIDRVLFPRDLDHREKAMKMRKGPRKVPARLENGVTFVFQLPERKVLDTVLRLLSSARTRQTQDE